MKLTKTQLQYLDYVRKNFPKTAFELTLQTMKTQLKSGNPSLYVSKCTTKWQNQLTVRTYTILSSTKHSF